MAKSPNFMDVLDTPAEEVKRPPAKPAGFYLGAVQGIPEQKTVQARGEENKVVEFKIKLIAAQEGVDQDQLADLPDISSWPTFNKSFWYEADAAYGMTQFLTEALGIEKAGKSIREMLSEAPGKQALFELTLTPGVDKNTGEAVFYNNIGKTAKA